MGAVIEIELRARDQRFLRGAREVLKLYELHRLDLNKHLAEVKVTGGQDTYTVAVRKDWAKRPHCSCPDARFTGGRKNGGYCKHVIAVLLKYEDLRCQLLEVLL